MAKHKLKLKKVAKGKQWRANDLIVINRHCFPEYVPASHHAEDRTGKCGRCGHYWDWHDNVWMQVNEEGKTISARVRCRGGYVFGLSVCSCQCREVYPG